MKPETEIAKILGLPRTQLIGLRRLYLQSGEDWQREHKLGGRIMWTEEGEKKIREYLKLETPTPQTNGLHEETVPTKPETRRLTVSFLPMNPYVLNAVDSAGTKYLVRVQSNLVFALNDTIVVRESPTEINVWMQTGPKPKHRGDNHYKWMLKNNVG